MKSIFRLLVFILGFSLTLPAEPPADNIIKVLSCLDNPSLQEVSPLALSPIVSVGALSSNGGKQIDIFLSNGVFTAKQMANEYVLPLKNKKEFILVLTFLNPPQPVVDGEYSPKAGYGKPFWCYAVVRVFSGPNGTNASFMVNEGKAVLAGIKAGRISGSFQMMRKSGDKVMAEVTGTFDVPLTIEK